MADDFWVDEDEFGVRHRDFRRGVVVFIFFAFFRDVHDDDTAVNVDLCCRKTDAVCFVHGGKHVIGDGFQAVVKGSDGFGYLAQALVGVNEDIE